MEELTMDKLVYICKQYGFIFSGSEIYGGLANTWDYGPLGVEVKNNVKKALSVDKIGKNNAKLNENIIKGWENISMIRNLFSQRRKLELGETIKLSVHHHELIYSNHSMKPGYGYSGWSCDICRRSYKHDVTNFFCPLCGWDLCDICYDKYKNS